jgi:hypothetical protein
LAAPRGGGGNFSEKFWREMECNAAITNAVIVAAFKALVEISQHNGARVQQRPAGLGFIVERTFDNGRNGELLVRLLEGVIARARIAWIFGNAPIIAA